jgi:hypothetical protein
MSKPHSGIGHGTQRRDAKQRIASTGERLLRHQKIFRSPLETLGDFSNSIFAAEEAVLHLQRYAPAPIYGWQTVPQPIAEQRTDVPDP